MNISEIEKLTQEYSVARDALAAHVEELQSGITALKKQSLPKIRRQAERVAEKYIALHGAIEAAPDLFVKPKTVIFHGVKIGYVKGRGEITWEDTDQVLKLIKKHFPDQVDMLIKIEEKPIKAALAQLAVADLKRIGVTVTETNDQIVIKPTDSEIDRLVNALLKDEEIAPKAA